VSNNFRNYLELQRKMKKIALLLILGVSLFSVSCSKFLENDIEAINKKDEQDILDYISKNNLQMIKTQTGLRYVITQNSISGKNAELGDEVSLHYVVSLLSGAKVDSTSRLKNEMLKFPYGGVSIIQGLAEAVSLLKQGERGTFLVPSILAFGSTASANIPANSVLKIDLEAVKYRSEVQQMDEYIKATKLQVTETTATGLRFLRTVTTNGTALKAGLLATVKYTGYLASNATQFDSGQIDVALGDGAVVKGFEEGLLKMKVGEKATLVFPSAIGYGTTGSGAKIPPYAPLIFNVEVVSVK
jgi:FKBP-type peptidyl-prolyl cis-trans isomerase